MSYCKAIPLMREKDFAVHKNYHDTQYGFAIENDDELFCRLVLEINQAGLSWTTILHKEQNFRQAYSNFNIKKVAAYKDADVERLLNDEGIIRNRLKVHAAIHNASQILNLQKQFGSFKSWIDTHHPLPKADWVKLFKTTFRFTGGEIVNEFLMSTGYLTGAHDEDCPVYKKLLRQKPAWKTTLKK
ncbi:MAG: DNA-3-methyladenine glycosylase I [Ferruginibacter sp.]